MTEFVEVQQLAGNRVRDRDNRVAGRIESIAAERIGPRCVIHEYHLGTSALLERLGITTLRLFGVQPKREPLRVPWQQMDLSDPSQPRLRCTLDELKAIQSELAPMEIDGPPKRPVQQE